MSERVQIDLLLFLVVFLLGAVVAVTRAWWHAEHTYRVDRREARDRRRKPEIEWPDNKRGNDRRKN